MPPSLAKTKFRSSAECSAFTLFNALNMAHLSTHQRCKLYAHRISVLKPVGLSRWPAGLKRDRTIFFEGDLSRAGGRGLE